MERSERHRHAAITACAASAGAHAALALAAAAVLLIITPGSSGAPHAVVQLIPTMGGRGSLTHKEARP